MVTRAGAPAFDGSPIAAGSACTEERLHLRRLGQARRAAAGRRPRRRRRARGPRRHLHRRRALLRADRDPALQRHDVRAVRDLVGQHRLRAEGPRRRRAPGVRHRRRRLLLRLHLVRGLVPPAARARLRRRRPRAPSATSRGASRRWRARTPRTRCTPWPARAATTSRPSARSPPTSPTSICWGAGARCARTWRGRASAATCATPAAARRAASTASCSPSCTSRATANRRRPPASSGRTACGQHRSRRTAPIPARWRYVPSGRTST